MQPLIMALILYGVILPLTIFTIAKLHKLFFVTMKVRRDRKKKRKTDFDALPKPLGPRIMKRVMFAFKDKRGFALKPSKPTRVQTRWIFFALYLVGLGFMIAATYQKSFTYGFASIIIALIALWFALQTSNKAIRKRNDAVRKIAEMAGRHFKIDRSKSDPDSKFVKIDKWNEYTRPAYVRIFAGRAFSPAQQKSFMEEFNLTYGKITSWVADPNAEGTGGTGWDHEEGVAYLKSKPPLPMRADWHEGYVLDEGVAWSFFPLALGLEGGVEMPSPETGEKVNVIGFDLSDKQQDAGEAKGYKVAKELNAATPQVFIGGSTGGGKAHPIDTEVVVLNAD